MLPPEVPVMGRKKAVMPKETVRSAFAQEADLEDQVDGALGLPTIIVGDSTVWPADEANNLVEVNWGRRSGFVQVGVCESLLTVEQRAEREFAHFTQLDEEGVRALINTLRRSLKAFR